MIYPRKCYDCKKELSGKYFFFTHSHIGAYMASRVNFCSLCCDKRKKGRFTKLLLARGEVKVIEKEIGDKLMDEISEFEDKWEKNSNLGINKIDLPDNKTFLNSIQKARQELESYLQKPEVVKKAWLREYNGDVEMSFLYLFSKSVRNNDYKQKVVQPTVEKILGEKLDEEINTTTTGNSFGVPGWADGDFKINGKLIGKYNWVDHLNDCRRLSIKFLRQNQFAFQAYLRALEIKEKELKGNQEPEKLPLSPQKENKPLSPSRILIVSLVIGGVILVAVLSFIFWKRKR